MSRSVSAGILDAITSGTSYDAFVYARLLPSRIFYTSITEDYAVAGADATGFPDSPMPQDIGTDTSAPSSPEVHTFVNDGGTLKVATNGSSSLSSLGQSLDGKPGVTDDTLYRISGGSIHKHTITWSGPSLGGGSNIGTPSESPLHVHGVSDSRCAFLSSGSGGLRPGVIDNTTVYEHDGRFMFPNFIETSGSGRSMSNLALYSGALELGGRVFIYVTSLDGTVQGCYWDEDSKVFSDFFTAVPTQLDVSLCEFRVANAYTHGGVAYLAGQFKRTENVETDKYYSMVLKSEDGRNFSIDRFSSVSELGYRFLATVGADNIFYLSNCNRVCHSPVTYRFDGNNDNGLKLVIPQESIKRFGTNNESGNISLKSGDETLLFDAYMEEGNKLETYLGYQTSSGSDADLFGSYIVSQKSGGIKDGGRNLDLSLLSEGHWLLQNHTSPFYTEFMGKSSLFDDMNEEAGSMYVAPATTLTKNSFFVDFWDSIPHTDTNVSPQIIGVSVIGDGGAVDVYPGYSDKNGANPIDSGNHRLGFKTKDLKTVLGLDSYPVVDATSVSCDIQGWSHPNNSSETTDIAEVLFVMEDANGDESFVYSNSDQRFEQTWPDIAANNGEVLTVTVSGLTIGDKIKQIGVIMECVNGTQFVISRVEVSSNVTVKYTYDDPNTPWDYSTSGSGYEIPGTGRPYIMFLQKPFNSYNFSVAASFEHTVNGPISTYPTAVGLVGHAEDGNNLVVGRYNRSNNKAEIVKIRDGIETELVSGTPSSGSPAGDFVDLLFTHRDGRYKLFMPDGSGEWLEELVYDWTDTDGYQFTSATITMKCGIYGYLSSPSFRITGINMLTQEKGSNVDGIAMLPMEDITDFPTSGEVRIEDCTYEYTSKETPPTSPDIRGPFQLRQNNSYTSPYGDGYGLENRDFNWTASTSLVNRKLIAISNGSVFTAESSTAALWKIFIKTAGVTYYQYQRARFYSENTLIATQRLSTRMKTWVTGGLEGITKTSGEATLHTEGTRCELAMDGTVLCHWAYGAGGEDDVTVEDLIQKISAHAGVKTEFPGDVLVASQAVGAGYKVDTVEYRDGFDLLWESATADNFTVEADVQDTRYPADSKTKITLTNTGGQNYKLIFTSEPSSTVIETFKFTHATDGHHFRVLYHDNFISVYMDGKWIHTFGAPEFVYDISNDVYLGGSFTATNIRLKDLCDWREAVYIDLETDAMSAINSVIQERPIETIWRSNGGTAYWYDIIRDTVTQVVLPKSHDWTETTPKNGASDAIVYGYKDVKCLQYQPYHENYGFATKVMRFPNLKTGALKAAREVLEREFESRIKHTVKIRPDLRLEVGDILDVDYNATATDTAMAFDIIIESIALDLAGGKPNMTIKGREDYVG